MQRIAILGSTGSIGQNALAVIAANPDRYQIAALSAYTQVEKLLQQCQQFTPQYAITATAKDAHYLSAALSQKKIKTEVLYGAEALEKVAADTKIPVVIAAIVGAAGLASTLAAICASKRVLLANKEALVMSGKVFIEALCCSQATLMPVDSEHNALLQCMPLGFQAGSTVPEGVEEIILTASGGPFLHTPIEMLATRTPQQAVAHPNWKMGAKISVDSATMANKGLEMAEAFWLFGLPMDKIKIILHPQSVIHSMVRYIDGSVLAQMGLPDMRTPLASALAWPKRIKSGVGQLDFTHLSGLEFLSICLQRYPCLRLAQMALQQQGNAMTVFNAANEIAVAAFLNEKIAYTEIAMVIEHTLNKIPFSSLHNLEDVMISHELASREAQQFVNQKIARVQREAHV